MHIVPGIASSTNILHLRFFLTFIRLIIFNKEGNGTQINAIFLGYLIHTHTHTRARARARARAHTHTHTQ